MFSREALLTYIWVKKCCCSVLICSEIVWPEIINEVINVVQIVKSSFKTYAHIFVDSYMYANNVVYGNINCFQMPL